MQIFNNAAEVWFDWMVAASWQIALLIAIVALLGRFLNRFSPRLQYGLWLLVLVKIFLPPSFASRWSLRGWLFEPVYSRFPITAAEPIPTQIPFNGAIVSSNDLAGLTTFPSFVCILFLAWIAGAVAFALIVIFRYLRITRKLRGEPAIHEGPFRIAFESIAIRLGTKRLPELQRSDLISGPVLLGILNPRIMIPSKLIGKLTNDEIRSVLTHELVHWRRMDSLIGWVQSFAQTLFWFHPFVWWANNQIRHQREYACDEISIRDGGCQPHQYGETIIRVLTLSRGCSAMPGGLIGIFGTGSKLQNRMEKIMGYEIKQSNFGWVSRTAILAFAFLLLPMSAIRGQNDVNENADRVADTPYPQIVETVPDQGATDVDPGLDSITVKFDRDMSEGMSWTGGKPYMPTVDKKREIGWTDKRTCVMPVKLEKGKLYRIGINAKDYTNFQSADGTPIPPQVFAFTTSGASKGMQAKVKPPKVVRITPDFGSTDVSAATRMLKVTFNITMGEGMSWTGGGENFPAISQGKRPKWSSDKKSCILPVDLKPNWTYRLGLNSLSNNNFQSQIGIPLEPMLYEFSTVDE